MDKGYTGRQIAIFTDVHALYEPLVAVLNDIQKRGITEIYSLGDNIGVGPNPLKVMNLLEQYQVKSIAGNSEDYVTLGTEPFSRYFNALRTMSHTWTLSKLGEKEIGKIQLYPHSIDLILGGKKLALCHFANDVRVDFTVNGTAAYQKKYALHLPAYEQFSYTNSVSQKEKIHQMLDFFGKEDPSMQGYVSYQKEPLFNGKQVAFYDAIFQGHVHFKIYESSSSTNYYSIRALGMAYGKDPVDSASYVILHETTDGYELEEVLVQYDREKMIYSILSSDIPDLRIEKFTAIQPDEIKHKNR